MKCGCTSKAGLGFNYATLMSGVAEKKPQKVHVQFPSSDRCSLNTKVGVELMQKFHLLILKTTTFIIFLVADLVVFSFDSFSTPRPKPPQEKMQQIQMLNFIQLCEIAVRLIDRTGSI